MYEKFFGFRQPPFATSTEQQQLFFAETHREALARLVYGMLAHKPLIILTGDVGLGKSTMLRAALARVATHQSLRVVALPHPLLRPGDVLRYIGRELEMPNAPMLRVSDLDIVNQAIKKCVAEGQRLALVIDEAQSLPAETLEFVRLMSNLDTGLSGHFQIVLVGQPELWDMLQKSEFRHLRQRIAIRAELQPLSRIEAGDYLRHRLKQAGAVLEQVFTGPAIKALIGEGHGAPRRLNCIADNALLLAFGDQKKPVEIRQVQLAAETQDKLSDGWMKWRRWFRTPWVWITVPVLAAIAFVTAAVILFPEKPAPALATARHEPRAQSAPAAAARSESAAAPANVPAGQEPEQKAASPGPIPPAETGSQAIGGGHSAADPADTQPVAATQTESAATATLAPSDPAARLTAAATSSRQRISQ